MCKSIRSSCFFLSFLSTLFAFSFVFVFYCPVIVSAAQVTMEWDKNSEEGLSGYRVFCRQEGHNYDYYNPVWEGTENTCTISGDVEDTRCFFVVRAFNTSNIESGNSNEVFIQPDDPPETCTDADSDGYYAQSGCGAEVDCNDSDPNINPGATEICDDNKDNDCNGAVDCADLDCRGDVKCSNYVTIHTPPDYVTAQNLGVGDEYYLDRNFTLTSIPPELDTGTEEWIKTKNGDKDITSTSFLEFTLSHASTVYVAYDSRADSLPNWLSYKFSPTSMSIEVEDNSMLYFDVFARSFPAGTIKLGGNLASGAYGAQSNYIVIVQARTTVAVPEICYNGLDDDLDGLIDCSDPDCDCDITFDVTIVRPADYVATNFLIGDSYYLDRDYAIISAPYDLSEGNEVCVKTKNDDKFNASASFLQINISQASTVYVAYDSRADSLPNWLSDNFSPTSMSIEVEDYGMLYFDVYARSFPAGTVTLGGNLASGAYGAQSNYIVIVKPSS